MDNVSSTGSKYCVIFAVAVLCYLEVSGGCEYRFDSSHSIVVMVLGGELLRAETICRHDLDRSRAGIDKPTRVENNLGNHGIIWNHHSNGAKQRL